MGAARLELAGCAWEPLDDVGAKSCEHVGEETITQCEDEDDWSAAGAESCKQAGLSSVRLRAVRLGPFYSLPGQWRSLSTYAMRGLLGDGDRVVGFVGTPTAEDGYRSVGYPPLHASGQRNASARSKPTRLAPFASDPRLLA